MFNRLCLFRRVCRLFGGFSARFTDLGANKCMPDRQFIRLHLNLCRQNTFHSANIFLYFFFHQGDVTLRFHCASVQVQVLSGAPNLGTTYDTKTVIQIGWLFLYMARKPLKTLGLSALRMPRQTLRCPAFHSGVQAAEIAEKNGCRAAPFRKWTRVHGATAPWPSPTKSALREKVLLFRGGRFFVYRMVKASRSSVSV